MARRTPKAIGTAGETLTLRNCLVRVWPRMERSGSKVAYGDLPDYDDPAQRCPWAWEHKAAKQQRLELWWVQTVKSATKVGLLPGLLWKREGFPKAPWVIFDWPSFEPVARFIDAHIDEFRAFLSAEDEADVA